MKNAGKWLGGTVAVSAILAATMLFAGRALEAQEARQVAPIEAEDVLDDAIANPAAGNEPSPPAGPAFDADDPFVIKSILPIEGAIKYGEWHWDESNAPAEGPLVVTVDLHARVISVFRSGHEIGAAAALLGTDEHPTPVGTFPILTKERHNVSEKYNNAPMPWTLRLTWDGVAIHGGSTVELGYASHGCIGVPDQFVSKLYDIARVGDRVIITDGQTAGIGTSLASS